MGYTCMTYHSNTNGYPDLEITKADGVTTIIIYEYDSTATVKLTEGETAEIMNFLAIQP